VHSLSSPQERERHGGSHDKGEFMKRMRRKKGEFMKKMRKKKGEFV
jgi:hypothetical protein